MSFCNKYIRSHYQIDPTNAHPMIHESNALWINHFLMNENIKLSKPFFNDSLGKRISSLAIHYVFVTSSSSYEPKAKVKLIKVEEIKGLPQLFVFNSNFKLPPSCFHYGQWSLKHLPRYGGCFFVAFFLCGGSQVAASVISPSTNKFSWSFHSISIVSLVSSF